MAAAASSSRSLASCALGGSLPPVGSDLRDDVTDSAPPAEGGGAARAPRALMRGRGQRAAATA